jgi:hypothetical protein
MQLKIDENGNAVVRDGHPIYVDSDGAELVIDVPSTLSKLAAANAEAKERRLKITELEKEKDEYVQKYSKIENVGVALKALETVKNLDDKSLVDAGQMDILKAEMANTYNEKEAALKKGWGEKEKVYDDALKEKEDTIYNLLVTSKFSTSPFVTEKLVLPSDIAANTFGHNFRVEGEGKNLRVVGYHNGEKIHSRTRYGDEATFDEAMEFIVDKYSQKDRILKSSGTSGSGASGNASGGAGPKTIPRSDKEAISRNIDKIATGEIVVV